MKTNEKRSSRRKNIQTDQKSIATSMKIHQNLEQIEVNGQPLFSCKICNRLYSKVDAIEHFKTCKSQDLHSKTISDQQENGNDKINNNYIENKESNDCNKNIQRLRKRANKTNNFAIVPKKRNMKNEHSNVELNNPQTEGKPVQTRKRGKKLTEDEIAERLKKISEKLKKKDEANNRVQYEEHEEDERQEIEQRLMALNKDSEISYFNDYPDIDDRLKDEHDVADVNSTNSTDAADKMSVGNPNSENRTSNLSQNMNGPIIITQRPDGQLHGCPHCPEVCVSELELYKHKKAKHTAPKIIIAFSEVKKLFDIADRSHCPICQKILHFNNKTRYIKHLVSHTHVAEHECSVCKKKFKRKDQMRMHQKRHIV